MEEPLPENLNKKKNSRKYLFRFEKDKNFNLGFSMKHANFKLKYLEK